MSRIRRGGLVFIGLSLLTSTLIAVACRTPSAAVSRAHWEEEIDPLIGRTQADVRNQLGEPKEKEIRDGFEVWTYAQSWHQRTLGFSSRGTLSSAPGGGVTEFRDVIRLYFYDLILRYWELDSR